MTWLLILVTITGITSLHTTEAQCKASLAPMTGERTRALCISPQGELFVWERGRGAVLQP